MPAVSQRAPFRRTGSANGVFLCPLKEQNQAVRPATFVIFCVFSTVSVDLRPSGRQPRRAVDVIVVRLVSD